MRRPRALVLDYGGVLTAPLGESFHAFEVEIGVAPGRCVSLLVDASRISGGGPIGALERGEIEVDEFEALLREMLIADGYDVPQVHLIEGLFRGAVPAGKLWHVAAAAHERGVSTALLSNSWGNTLYPFDRLDEIFDTLVISGDVGMRKPEERIYELTLDRLDVAADEVVFVDDLPRNVEVARNLGMQAIHHDGDDASVAAKVAVAFDLDIDIDLDHARQV